MTQELSCLPSGTSKSLSKRAILAVDFHCLRGKVSGLHWGYFDADGREVARSFLRKGNDRRAFSGLPGRIRLLKALGSSADSGQ